MKQAIEFAIGLNPFAAIMMIWVDDLETMDPELQQQRWVLRQQIAELLLDYRHDMKHWCVPSLGVNYSGEFFTQLRRIGLEGPLWQHVRGPLKPAPRSRAPQSIG